MDLFKLIKDKVNSENTFTIVFIGDSITSAEWVHPNWVEILEYVLKDQLELTLNSSEKAYWYLRFINCGLDGGKTLDFMNCIDNEVVRYKPDLVICTDADNDLHYMPTINHISIVTTLKEKLSQFPLFVYISNSNGSDKEEIALYKDSVDELNKMTPLPNEIYLDLFNEFQSFDLEKLYTLKLNSVDAKAMAKREGDLDLIHPNPLGNAYIVKILLTKLFNINFLPAKYIAGVASGEKCPEYQ